MPRVSKATMDLYMYGSPLHAERAIADRDMALTRLADIRQALDDAHDAQEFSGMDGSRQCLFAAARLLERVEDSICAYTTQEVERTVKKLRGMKPQRQTGPYPRQEATALLRLYRATQPKREAHRQEQGAPK